MNPEPTKPVQPPQVNPTVAKSIAKPDAFGKAGSMASGKGSKGWSPAKGMRFRPLKVTRQPGRPRKHPRDPRDVIYFLMTRSPKTTFSTSAHRAGMEKISATEDFLAACDYALLVHAEEIIDPMNPTGLAQIIGARRALEILKTIGDPIPEETPTKHRGLNYNT